MHDGGGLKLRIKKVLVGVGIAGLLLALVLQGVDWGALWQSLRDANRPLLAAVVAVTVVAYWLRAWRWGDLLAPLVRVPQPDLFSATMLGFSASLIVPRSGELLRPWLVSRRHAVTGSAAFATIVIERLIDLVTVVALLALYLFVLPHPAAQTQDQLTGALMIGGAVAAFVALGLLAFLLALHANAQRALAWLQRWLAYTPPWLAKPIGRLLHSFADGLAVLRAPALHLLLIGVKSIVLWLATAWSFHLTQQAFAIELPFQTTFLLMAFLVVGESIPTPGLVGGFHAFYVLALSEVLGVDKTAAVAAALTAHALTNLPVLLLGLACLGRERFSFGQLFVAAEAQPPGKP